jgi:hypothetical protein
MSDGPTSQHPVAISSNPRVCEVNFWLSRGDLDLERALKRRKVLARSEKWLFHVEWSLPVVAQQEDTERDFHFIVCEPSARSTRDGSANLLRSCILQADKREDGKG